MDGANQKKKLILYGIIATIAIFVVVLVILMILMSQDSKKTRVVFGGTTYKTRVVDMTAEDGKKYEQKNITYQNKELPIILNTPDGKEYYCIETLATMTGYKYNKGAYGELDENTNKCHIDNGGEFVTFSTDVNGISKNIKISDRYDGELAGKENQNAGNTDANNETEEEELFSLDKPVIKFADGKLYASYDAITQGFNMSIVMNGNQVVIYSLSDLIDSYGQFLNTNGYTLTQNFRNQRALYKGLAVAEKNGKYGVIELKDNGGFEEVISVKYDTVEYVQSIGEFIISSNSMYGMISPGSEQPTISLKYDTIQLLDAEKKLYIVGVDRKFGVVNSNGDTIVPTEYDEIGLPDVSMYRSQGITNRHLITDNCIPVMKNNEYGLFNPEGFNILKTRYYSIGCENPAELIENTSAMPTLVVPLSDEVNCLVYSRKNNVGVGYGLITTDGKIVLEAYYTAIYYITTNGKTTYYFNKVNNNQLETLEELIDKNDNLKKLIEDQDSQKKTKEELEKDTEQEKKDIENQNNGNEDNPEEIAKRQAQTDLEAALNGIADSYYANNYEEELSSFLVNADNYGSMEGYQIVEINRDDNSGRITIIFQDNAYQYEADVTDTAEIIEIR